MTPLEAATLEASKDPRRIDYNKVQELTLNGWTIDQIAAHLGCGHSSVSRARARLGVTNPAHPNRRKVDLDQLRELHGQGLSRQELAEHFGCTPERITAARRQLGIAPEAPGSGRYKVIDREEVRTRTQQGQTLEQIADALGCSIRGIASVKAELGLTQPRPLTPERIERIGAMVADECSHAEIVRTLHTATQTIERLFPGTAWTPEQRADHIRTLRLERKDNWGGLTRRRVA